VSQAFHALQEVIAEVGTALLELESRLMRSTSTKAPWKMYTISRGSSASLLVHKVRNEG
jgi:hypothetical protein